MVLHIKNMVCNRCKMVVETELNKLGLETLKVELGTVSIKQKDLTAEETTTVATALEKFGLELLVDKQLQLVDLIKATIIELVHYNNQPLKVNLSTYLSDKLNAEYQVLSATFSENEHRTIEQFFIGQKIEKVKELLSYGEKNLSEIAYYLNYSSVAHLSSQFKKVTRMTPSQFKSSISQQRKGLDEF